MKIQVLLVMISLLTMTFSCTKSQALAPASAQQQLKEIWRADRHILWEIDWPAAPIGDPVTVETWRAGERYRFEILEAPAPALIGETVVFDGRQGWQYNRFEPPASFEPNSAELSPVSEAFAVIDHLLEAPAESAAHAPAQVNFEAAEKIELTFANDDHLSLWWSQENKLPLRIVFIIDGRPGTLNARQADPLPNPPPGLFEVGDWVR